MPKACSYWATFCPSTFQQSLGLLRAEVDGLVIADGDLIGAFAGGEAKDELKIPDADANLDAVGVGFAIIGRLGKVELGLCGWTHGSIRLLRLGAAAPRLRPANLQFPLVPWASVTNW